MCSYVETLYCRIVLSIGHYCFCFLLTQTVQALLRLSLYVTLTDAFVAFYIEVFVMLVVTITISITQA